MKTKISFSFLAKLFFVLFIIFIPFQIKTLFFSEYIFAFGFFNPYGSHYLYLTDILLFLSFFFFLISLFFTKSDFKISFGNKNIYKILILIIFFTIFSLLISVNTYNSVFYVLRFLEFLILYFLIVNKVLSITKILYIFVSIISFTAIIGILQYLFQSSLGLFFLGEPLLSLDVPGISKIIMSNSEVLRSYSVFPHPNIFAGYLLTNIIFIFTLLKNSDSNEKILLYLLLFISFIALLLTFSRSAILALLGAIFLYFTFSSQKINFHKLFISIFLIVFVFFTFDLFSVFLSRTELIESDALTERIELLRISKYMFLDNIFGVGVGNFTYAMQDYSSVNLQPWEFQPVHNIFMLIMTEQGILSLLLYLYLFYNVFKNLIINRKHDINMLFLSLGFSLLIIGLFDHYLISLYPGQLLLFLYLSLVSSNPQRVNGNHLKGL